MKQQEIVFREISCKYLEGQKNFTQLGLSKRLGISLSIVNKAIASLDDISAVRIKQRSFDVIALDRLLLYWATHRNLRKDIVYQTRADMPVKEIERNMPEGIAFTGYTGYRFTYGESPADYSEIYLYAAEETLETLKRRFKQNDKIPNIIVLKTDTELERAIMGHKLKHSSVCASQLFVDLWNMREWYSKEFVDSLAKRLEI